MAALPVVTETRNPMYPMIAQRRPAAAEGAVSRRVPLSLAVKMPRSLLGLGCSGSGGCAGAGRKAEVPSLSM